ncbi:MAG: SDR family oxidoreductase [Alphaproteobacteria bacterium]|nr:SDR family oxidoreductase [Alphaproteobacteria bacterium]
MIPCPRSQQFARPACELGSCGVTINAIAPSLTLTERIRPHWQRLSPDAQAAEIARTPLRRVAEVADQAKVICFLASRDADFMSGVTIDVTGGIERRRHLWSGCCVPA